MIALSVVNFGMLSIWLNSTVAILDIIYHLVFIIVVIVYRKSFTSANTLLFEQHDEALGYESFDDLDKMPLSKPPSIAYNNLSLIALVFLLVANTIAFCIMVDVTTLGAMRSTLPAERVGSHQWNIKIQMAQTAVLGSQVLALGALVGISAWGRRRIILEEESKSGEIQFVV